MTPISYHPPTDDTNRGDLPAKAAMFSLTGGLTTVVTTVLPLPRDICPHQTVVTCQLSPLGLRFLQIAVRTRIACVADATTLVT